MDAGRDEAGDVRHVGEHRSVDASAGRANPREVDHARVRAGADDDHLRLVLVGEPIELVVVDPLVALAHAVGHDCVQLAGEIQRMAVGQMAAVREVHAEHRIARLEQREVDGHVRLRARVRLHVGVLGGEQRFRARDGGALGDVDELAAAVVPPPGIPFGVFVRHHRSRRLEDGAADEILGRDELEAAVLTVQLVADRAGDLGIRCRQRAPERNRGFGRHTCVPSC